jgi:c-di-GMP-binding flagellar brake protein YcgR
MIPDEPVYLAANGINIDPVVEELGGGGARLVCRRQFDRFHKGQALGRSVLMLNNDGVAEVYPIVRWTKWPNVGVEFTDISEKDRRTIMRFLFKIERRRIQMEKLARREMPVK